MGLRLFFFHRPARWPPTRAVESEGHSSREDLPTCLDWQKRLPHHEGRHHRRGRGHWGQ